MMSMSRTTFVDPAFTRFGDPAGAVGAAFCELGRLVGAGDVVDDAEPWRRAGVVLLVGVAVEGRGGRPDPARIEADDVEALGDGAGLPQRRVNATRLVPEPPGPPGSTSREPSASPVAGRRRSAMCAVSPSGSS